MSKVSQDHKKGKRYTPEERTEAVCYVHEYNRDNGRGGLTAAYRKFGISQVTLRSWLMTNDIDSSHTEDACVFRELAKLSDEIAILRKGLEQKEAEYTALKAKVF
jgi:transposase-like protein